MPGFLAECEAAERVGFSYAYSGEKHIGDTTYSTNPFLACMRGLGHTEKLGFGTSVTVLPTHHPVRVAEDACLIDAMFPGRFRLTVGVGYFQGDFDPFGVTLKERKARMDIGMEVIAAHRAGTPMDIPAPLAGKVPPRDPALGPDNLEVFIGAWSVPGVLRAARTCDGWITDPIRSGRWIRHLADVYVEECERLGKKPRIVLFREAWIDETDKAARDMYGQHVLDYSRVYYNRGNAYHEDYDPWLKDIQSADDLPLDHVLPDRVLCGSAQTWLEQIEEWREALDPEEMIVRLRHFQGPGIDETLAAMEQIGTDIIPHFANDQSDDA
jgi:alkanesulfonate monooxygenase SsuD/methylene tetrahydromethanopterin reductase-like flavin-dependent oxidoreductase (luciferase family)